jgi:uncharacterized repeat protein (TIGR04138 family)
MKKISFNEALAQIIEDDPRYDEQAYMFVREGLDFTIKALNKPQAGPARHVSGKELLDGLRIHAINEFGPMALRVLNTWGIHDTMDFGHIVFNMVDKGILGKTDEDRREEFKDGYDFNTAFIEPFHPSKPQQHENSASPHTDTGD